MILTSIGQSFTHQLLCLVFIINFSLTFCFQSDYHRDQHDKPNGDDNDDQLVAIENGLVKGKLETILDRKVTSYLGIPYAEPPVGDGRFRKPKPFRTKFDGVYNATYFRPACSQKLGDEAPENLGGVSFSEDCLHLNIWVPQSDHTHRFDRHSNRHRPLKPVLFYSFASAFHKSSPARPNNRGEYLSSVGDIIVVTPNYRIGFLGFACCGQDDDDMPGNLGLYDLILALKWTRENIKHFGGDPEAITLSGSSAGGMLSILLLQSGQIPDSWINNIFIMSGIPANEVTIDSVDVSIAKTRLIAEKVNCSKVAHNNQSSSEVAPLTKDEVNCLRDLDNLTAVFKLQDSEEIISIGESIKNGLIPVYGDKLVPSSPEFTFDRGFKLNHINHKSFVIGNVENEGYWKSDFWPSSKTEAFGLLLPKLRSMLKTDSIETIKRLNQTIDFYFNSIDEKDDYMINKAINQFYSDWAFICPSIGYGQHLATQGNLVHFYLFNYVPRSYSTSNERPFGATHGDDSRLFFGHPFRDLYNYDHHDRLVSRRLMEIYSDFVKNRRLFWPPILTNKFGKVKPLRWKINGHFDDKVDIDIVHSADHCDWMNKLRNYKLYEKLDQDSIDNQL
ncbi:acetylcholinesterase-1-like [Panonychus citri]|uniref:acetylcholinesterase-1-like n=1 Tax=Panonychus citri TaxID=50023 RepID=UPI002307DB7B|nr:acetylcholinesterase-1-like [Panonychus citri]